MTIYGLWHGGSSYGPSYVADNLEVFTSTQAAMDACADRYNMGHIWRQTFTYADGRIESVLTPCVDELSGMSLYMVDPRGSDDPYPDKLIIRGPRGGWKVTGY